MSDSPLKVLTAVPEPPEIAEIESLADVLERAQRSQLGHALKHEVVVAPSQAEQAEIGWRWFQTFKDELYPDGVCELPPDLYLCVERCARIYRNRFGLSLQWTSPHTFSYRQIRIINKGK